MGETEGETGSCSDGQGHIPSLLFTWGQTMVASLVAQSVKNLPAVQETPF